MCILALADQISSYETSAECTPNFNAGEAWADVFLPVALVATGTDKPHIWDLGGLMIDEAVMYVFTIMEQ